MPSLGAVGSTGNSNGGLPDSPQSTWADGDMAVWRDSNQRFEPAVPVFVADALADIIPVDVSSTTWIVSDTDAGNAEVKLRSAEYTQFGRVRHYRLIFSAREDDPFSFGVAGALELVPSYQQHWRTGSGDFAPGQALFTRVGSNELQLNRDDNIGVRCEIEVFFTAYMG